MSSAGEFAFTVGTLPSALSFEINSATLPGHSIFATARGCIRWGLDLGLLLGLFKWFSAAMSDVLGQRQVQGSTQSVVGTNASSGIAAGYAAVILSLLVGIPAGMATVFATQWSSLSGYFANIAGIEGGDYWNIATYVFPVDTLIACVFTYAIVRYVVGMPLVLFARVIVLLLVA